MHYVTPIAPASDLNQYGWVEELKKHKNTGNQKNSGYVNREVWIKIFTHEFFTLFPDYALKVFIGYLDNDWYIVQHAIAKQYHAQFKALGFCNATLYGGVTKKGKGFFLPVYARRVDKQGQDTLDKYGNVYDDYMELVENAIGSWVLIDSMNSIADISVDRKSHLPQPMHSPQEMLLKAFPGRFRIETEQHRLVQELIANNDIEELQ